MNKKEMARAIMTDLGAHISEGLEKYGEHKGKKFLRAMFNPMVYTFYFNKEEDKVVGMNTDVL